MNKYYYTGICSDGEHDDPTNLFVNKYTQGETNIFFGNKKSVIMISAETEPEITESDFHAKTYAEILDIDDPDLIDYGFNAEDFLNPAPPPQPLLLGG